VPTLTIFSSLLTGEEGGGRKKGKGKRKRGASVSLSLHFLFPGEKGKRLRERGKGKEEKKRRKGERVTLYFLFYFFLNRKGENLGKKGKRKKKKESKHFRFILTSPNPRLQEGKCGGREEGEREGEEIKFELPTFSSCYDPLNENQAVKGKRRRKRSGRKGGGGEGEPHSHFLRGPRGETRKGEKRGIKEAQLALLTTTSFCPAPARKPEGKRVGGGEKVMACFLCSSCCLFSRKQGGKRGMVGKRKEKGSALSLRDTLNMRDQGREQKKKKRRFSFFSLRSSIEGRKGAGGGGGEKKESMNISFIRAILGPQDEERGEKKNEKRKKKREGGNLGVYYCLF